MPIFMPLVNSYASIMKSRIFVLLSLLLILLNCSKTPDYVYQQVEVSNLPEGVRIVATGDLTGSSKHELICGKDSTFMVYSIERDSAVRLFKQSLTDEVLEIAVGNVDLDKGNELVVVTGDRRYKETDVKVYIIKAGEGWFVHEVFSKFSTRPHATTLQIADSDNDGVNEILLSYFESKYIVEYVSISLDNGIWQSEVLEQRRMAMTRAVGELPGFKGNQTVVGRVYGDEIGMTGDAYLLGEENIPVPAKRGVKAVVVADADNDGKNEIVLGDGWHMDYGKIARGRLAMVDLSGEEMEYELIEDVKGQYEVTQIVVDDINGDGLNEVVARGNAFTRFYQKGDEGWKVFRDTLFKHNQFAVGDITGDRHPEVIISGKTIGIYNFGQIPFTEDLDAEVVTEKVYPDSLIGEPAPELSILKWFNGTFPGLYNSKGKVIMLDFWATWCAPCKKTFPDLAILQEKYADQGFQIIGLTRTDQSQDEAKIVEFVEQQGFLYPIGLSNETLNKLAYGVGGIPHVVLIDKKGLVRWYKVGAGDPSELEEEIRNLLAE